MVTSQANTSRRSRLVMIANADVNHHPSFEEIRTEISARAPDIDCRVMSDRRLKGRRWALATRPTLVFSPVPLRKFRPIRGRVFAGNNMAKSDEYRALGAAGVPVPRWTMLGPGASPDLSDFAEYVVTKPDRGKRGANVKIKRRGRVRYKATTDSRSALSPYTLVQEFIYTGRWPVSYRVTSLFGSAVNCWRVEANRSRRPLHSPRAFAGGDSGGGMSIVSNAKDSKYSSCHDPEIIAFGASAHRAFPDIPLLGVDVVRDALTNKLYVLEVNASGYVWHLDSEAGRGIQRDHNLDFRRQFGVIDRAAEILITQTRTLAK